ncbi:hypothetical protein EIP86_003323 [Pleurotus ostreatoroseus]|nr:hypothetical protein EIP86_003323 [Pleurotus ostreatoroseus]
MADPTPFASRRTSTLLIIALFLLFNLCYDWTFLYPSPTSSSHRTIHIPRDASATLARCRALTRTPGPAASFQTHTRTKSDRFEAETKPVLVRNARLWTGRLEGREVFVGDVLLDGGIIRAVAQGRISEKLLGEMRNLTVVEADGAWVTPGIIDVHSHLGVIPSPALIGANDGNSIKGLAQPWLRSVDALNTHDEGYAHAIAGGLTTALVLPGSADAIGGQAFPIKLRPTKERSPTSMLLEPSFGDNSSDPSQPMHWRHIKHACGENPSRTYDGTRMDTFWAFRKAYDTARTIKESQDEYCAHVLQGDWAAVDRKEFPESLQWEALVDVLRGRVKVQTHCYEAVDIDDFVRLSNEFKFPVAAFHHAHEAWLVPDVLKRAYEHPPAIAMFAAFSRYKREAYRHSEFAPRVLADNDIDVIMKSDHPAIVSRYLIHEAAQAHYWGLQEHIALSSVITTPARVLGLDHRVGYIQQDRLRSPYALNGTHLVIWDSHPLALGATPSQVFIDGISQITSPSALNKAGNAQRAPQTPDFARERADAVKYEGLPPLAPPRSRSGTVVFANVSHVWLGGAGGVVADAFMDLADGDANADRGHGVVVQDGRVVCYGSASDCATYTAEASAVVDLQGGALQPGLVSAGSSLGLQEIAMEPSTTDGVGFDPLQRDVPSIAPDLPRAVDGLIYGTRDALLAYRAGVTVAISAPIHYTFLSGLSTALSTGSLNKLEDGAVVQDVAAVHVSLSHGDSPSVSTEIAALRRLLLAAAKGEGDVSLQQLSSSHAGLKGEIPLVVEVNSADIIATVIQLKQEVESTTGRRLKITVIGGTEAHLVANELAKADIGVVLMPPRPFPYTWDYRRIAPGRPSANETAIATLVKAGVKVGLGPQGTNASPFLSTWAVRNLRFDAGWALLDNPDVINRASVFAMSSINVANLLGVRLSPYDVDLVATWGGDLLGFEGKVVAVISPRRGRVDFLEPQP